VKRFKVLLSAFAALLAVALISLSLAGYKSLKSMRAELREITAKVDGAISMAQQEATAASLASQRADQAAAQARQAASQAQIAAAARQQAEAEKQAADAGRAQALSAAQQAEENARRAEAEMAEMRREREEELNRMQQALDRVAPTHRTPNGMVIVLPDSTFRFAFDSAELNEKNRELLSRIAGILLVSKGYGLAIYGYTDDVGSAEYNQQLSVRRAKAVEDYLVQSGIDPTIITIKGYGKTSPLVPGTSAAARAKNRRVEIALADTSIRYMGEAPPPR